MIEDYQGDTPKTRFIEETLQTYSDEGDLEFERELIDSFRTSVYSHLPKLKKAMDENDLANATLYSHDIKGSCLYIGADAVRFLSGKMESYCRAERIKDAALLLDELELEVDEIFKILDKYVKIRAGESVDDEEEETEKKKKEEEGETPSTTASE